MSSSVRTVLFHGHFGHGIVQDLFHPNSWQTPVAAVTVYSAPDDGRKERPKLLAKYWLQLPEDGFPVNRNMLERLCLF